MRKRRVFALVLALSMVITSNTMTAFAAPENPTTQEQATQESGQANSGLTEAQKLAAQKRQAADEAKALADEKKGELEKAETALATAKETLAGLKGTADEETKQAAYDKWQAAGKTVGEKKSAVTEAQAALTDAQKALDALVKQPETPADGTGDQGAEDDTNSEKKPGVDTTVTAQTPDTDGTGGTDSPEVAAAKEKVTKAEAALTKAQEELQAAKEAEEVAKKTYEALLSPGDADAIKTAEDAVAEAQKVYDDALKAYDDAQAAYETAEAEAVKAEEEAERDVSFTDPTGQKVTYDANEANTYIYEIENGVLKSVKKKGESEGSANIPVEFKGNIVLAQPAEGEQYTAVAANVFAGNADITYVKLPVGVTTVTAGSFKGCTSLTGAYLPTTVTKIEESAFENCTALTQISLPEAVTSIGVGAFKNDTKLRLVYIKGERYSSLKSIGASAFEGCGALAEFCSDDTFVLPNKLETIGERAFYGCKAITKVDMSDTNVNTVGAHAFEGCIGIRDLTTGKKLSLIDESAFSGCISLASIRFVNGVNLRVGARAFSGCLRLRQLTLPQSVVALGDGAFQGCTQLTQVEVKCYNIDLGGVDARPFPTDAANLYIIAEKDSNAYVYAVKHDIKMPDKDAFYQYSVEDVDGRAMANGKFPGGTLWVGNAGSSDAAPQDINTLNGKKGVKRGEKCYVYYSQTTEQKNPETGYTFIPGSLRCNGEPLKSENGKYYFEMPVGGAVITAEFRRNALDKIDGQKVKVEFSTGEPIQGGEKDEIGYLGVALRVGQKTRMYLVDETGAVVSASKVKYSSRNTKIATVNADGIITAVGTNGADSADAVITAKLIGGDGKEITVNRTVSVTTAEAQSIRLQASGYNSALVDVEGEKDGIQTASILKNLVNTQTLTIKLEAIISDGNDNVSRELTWTTSNSKVAVLAKDKTEAGKAANVITVQKGCEGEATITVTAKNSSNAEKEKITQKFVVRVYQKGYRLTASDVTVNPNSGDSGTIELISAYNYGLEDIKAGSLRLYEKNSLGTSRFTAEFDQSGSNENCRKFRVKPDAASISDGKYEVRVGINGETSAKELLPLTITVKHSMPNPAVKFNSKKTKFNLFYKNGGTDAEGNPIVVTTEVTKLGDDKIKSAALLPLTDKSDDKLFTENFVVDTAQSDYANGRIVIRRSEGNLKYTSKKAAAVTGYLVIYYEGYSGSAAKKIKVTMPTCTTAPSYALRETSAVYPVNSGRQDELLEVYDKKSKTKEKVVLDAAYSVRETAQELTRQNPAISGDGSISISFMPEKGKMKLVLQNENWDKDKNGAERTVSFTFTVNVSNKKPVFKNSTVTLNLNYPDVEPEFKLTANQRGLDLAGQQTFTPVVTKNNGSEINKLQVTYVNGQGVVKVAPGQTVKKGTYKFNCQPQVAGWPGLKTIALVVKVVDTKPAVKFGKGSLQLNTMALKNNNQAITSVNSRLVYRETAELSFKVNGAPEGYTLADVGTDAQHTQIQCVTKGRQGMEEKFSFYVKKGDAEEQTDNVLGVSLKDESVARGTYTFQVTPRYVKEGMTTVSAASVKVKVKVYTSADIALKVSAKGKLNLVNREGEPNDKNGIVYTPKLQYLSGEILDVKIFDAGSLEEESKYFDIQMITEGKDKGKFYVTPKKTVKTQTETLAETPVEYEYAQLEYNKRYPVKIWVAVDGYAGTVETKNGVLSKTIQIKASQVLPKVTASKTTLDVYLASKEYDATFIVRPKSGSAGAIEDVFFAEKDEKAKESFTLLTEPREDGSIKVIVHLKKGMEYPNGSTNNIKMYVKYKGQGDKTPETATAFNMKIRIN